MSSVWRYWLTRGLLKLGLQVMVGALRRKGAEAATPLRSTALRVAGVLALRQGLNAQARAYAEESLAVARAVGDPAGIAKPIRLLGILAAAQGDRVAARAYLEEALALLRQLKDVQAIGFALNSLALAGR
jgi:hypothetical protein